MYVQVFFSSWQNHRRCFRDLRGEFFLCSSHVGYTCCPLQAMAPNDFLHRCMNSRTVAGRWVSYNASFGESRRVVPLVITVAGVLDAVPLEPTTASALGAKTKVRVSFFRFAQNLARCRCVMRRLFENECACLVCV